MKSWTISKRITLGGLLLLFILSAVVTFSLLGLRVLDRKIDSIQQHVLPGITAIGIANSHFMNCYSSLLIAKETRDDTARLALVDRADSHLALAKEQLDIYQAAIESPEDRANFAELVSRLTAYIKLRTQYIAMLRAGQLDEAKAFVVTTLEPSNARMREFFDTMIRWNATTGRDHATNMSLISKRTVRGDVTISLLGFAVCLVSGYLIIRGVKQALGTISTNLTSVTHQIASAATQVAAASDTLARGSSEQAASLEETSASLEEMAAMTKQNSEGSLRPRRFPPRTGSPPTAASPRWSRCAPPWARSRVPPMTSRKSSRRSTRSRFRRTSSP